jgi:GDP-L-fucose synthase
MTKFPEGAVVLVTGSSGVAGHATVDRLIEAGYRVVAATSATVDLRDSAATLAYIEKIQPTGIIHLAARVHGLGGNVGSQGEMFLDNLLINTSVIEAAHLIGVPKIVAMGTVAAYPSTAALPIREDAVWAGRPHGSEAGYAQAKRAMFAQLEAYQDQYGTDYAIALSTNLYGPHDRFDEVRGHVLPSLVSKFHRAIQNGTDVAVWGSGKPTRDFLYSADAAAALQSMLEHGSGMYNMATGESVAIREAVETLAEVSGFTGEVVWDQSKPDGQAARVFDVSRLKGLGWKPQVELREGLRATYEWFAANVDSVRR